MSRKKRRSRGRSLNERFAREKRQLPVVRDEQFKQIDTIAAKAMATGKFGCDEGCSFCCHQPVMVAPQEVGSLFEAALQRGSKFVKDLAERTSTSRDRLRKLTDEERFQSDEPCPILIQGRCSLYAARPFACRSVLVFRETMASCETGETDVSLDAKTKFAGERILNEMLMVTKAPPLDLTMALAAVLERRNQLSTELSILFGGDEAISPMARIKRKGSLPS